MWGSPQRVCQRFALTTRARLLGRGRRGFGRVGFLVAAAGWCLGSGPVPGLAVAARDVSGPARCAPVSVATCLDVFGFDAAVVSPDGRHLYVLDDVVQGGIGEYGYGVVGWARRGDGALRFAAPVACVVHPLIGRVLPLATWFGAAEADPQGAAADLDA